MVYSCLSVSVCLPAFCPSVSVSCLFICLSVILLVCLPVFLPGCLFACLSVCPPVCLSVCRFVCLSVCLSACLFVCLSVYCLYERSTLVPGTILHSLMFLFFCFLFFQGFSYLQSSPQLCSLFDTILHHIRVFARVAPKQKVQRERPALY